MTTQDGPMTRTSLICLALLSLAGPLNAQAAAGDIPDWRRAGVCYEVFVRSFFDSDGDGVGDLRGLISKLDYINDGDAATSTDLAATCIWLMPVAQSPSYHGYDVVNYYEVNRDYGTNEDFRALITEARRRGIRVIVDLVLNHMSSEHPIFKSALLDPASPWRDWFIWSPAPRPAPGWQAPVWHRVPGRDEHYYGLFWSGMPDYDLASAAATAELKEVARFWLEDMGVDGFRIDAVGHFFEGPAGEWKHGAGVHPWLRDYQAYLRTVRPDAFTIGEVWDSIGAIRPYYPDQLDSYFMFEVADGLVNAVRSGSGAAFIAAVQKAQRDLPPGRWSPFLRNHDQTRTMTELRGHVPRARLAATLLLTLPGFPFVYYGEELGMTGDKPDPRLRTPMHWTVEPAAGFTAAALPWEPLQPDSFTANVAVQDSDPESLLNHYRRLIRMRAATPALGATGALIALESGTDGVVAFLRQDSGQTVLVAANLGDQRVSGVALSSADAVLSPGVFALRTLLGRTGATLRVNDDGRIHDWIPVPVLEPFEAHVFDVRQH